MADGSIALYGLLLRLLREAGSSIEDPAAVREASHKGSTEIGMTRLKEVESERRGGSRRWPGIKMLGRPAAFSTSCGEGVVGASGWSTGLGRIHAACK